MTRLAINFLATFTFLIACSSLAVAEKTEAKESEKETTEKAPTTPKMHFLIIGKGRIVDPESQQQRGIDAVDIITKAAKKFDAKAEIDSLAENVMTKTQYRRGQTKEKVTGEIFKKRLKDLAKKAKPQDTVIIYTHTHGLKDGFEKSQPLGGLGLDLPIKRTPHNGALLWDEYAQLLLKIPAKNVVVLTMACYAGGLTEHLNSAKIRKQWQERQKSGRNFVVLTSQNNKLCSSPIVIGGEVLNPFTNAFEKALNGEADGFALKDGKPLKKQKKDEKLTIGELIDYILHTTEHTKNEAKRKDAPANNAKPQVTGSFDRNETLSFETEKAEEKATEKDNSKPED